MFAVVLTTFAACDTTSEQRTNAAILTLHQSCLAYAGALEVLAGQKQIGALDPQQIAYIDSLNAVTDPICSNPTPPADPLEAISRVTTSIAEALLVANQHKVDVD